MDYLAIGSIATVVTAVLSAVLVLQGRRKRARGVDAQNAPTVDLDGSAAVFRGSRVRGETRATDSLLYGEDSEFGDNK